jgi:hypothetical protein
VWCEKDDNDNNNNKNADFGKKPRKIMPSSDHTECASTNMKKLSALSQYPALLLLATKGQPSDPPIFQLLCDQNPMKRKRSREAVTLQDDRAQTR